MKRVATFLACLALAFLPACRLGDLAASSGQAMFQDDFTKPWSGWTSSPAPGSVTSFEDGEMRVAIIGSDSSVVSVPGLDFGDVRIEADSIKMGGTDVNRIGLVCRYTDPKNYYFFIVSTDGFYGLGKISDGQASLLGMSQMQRSEKIQPQGSVNHLRADCLGNELTFYDNGLKLGTASDSDHASGDVGFFTGTAAEPGLDVIFDNFVVIRP